MDDKFSIFTWIWFRGWSIFANSYFTVTKHKIIWIKKTCKLYCFVLHLFFFKTHGRLLISSLFSTFCYSFLFLKYFFWYFAWVKFRGREVLCYFTRLVTLRNIICAKNCTTNLRFERYFSHHGRSISQNVASLNILVHDM